MAGITPGPKAIGSAIYSFAILAAIAYFSFAALQGEYGLTRQIEMHATEEELSNDLEDMRRERAALENKVHRLSDDFLDLDLLDEQARKVLGFARPDEIVIR
ncbi:septum formation initiator family protein [Paroceanicella profunda]|uniref:Septum formation initiator family protein n=1 Tax=Paroceanicella profunda TaxID=2579971 RepID=A0A5B8FUJ8_9RHOB|nr:septum formation initiator family protein [Paroceanicella profunda]QDL92406.1 septum formation initiator family protein [Paroceanicella profunda]